jgi:hypothetical protein
MPVAPVIHRLQLSRGPSRATIRRDIDTNDGITTTAVGISAYLHGWETEETQRIGRPGQVGTSFSNKLMRRIITRGWEEAHLHFIDGSF